MNAKLEPLPQRELALELRALVDLGRKHPEHRTRALGRLTEIVGRYPIGVRSSHVRHNLGVRRMRWLVLNVDWPT